MIRRLLPCAVPVVLLVAPLGAQEQGGFAIIRDHDTIALERWDREDVQLSGTLVRPAGQGRERVRYRATLVDDESAPLVEVSAWRGDDPEESPARQTVRLIFREDSVAVDDVNRWDGVGSRVLATQRAAVPYLNLSVAMLELATRRFRRQPADRLEVPFFNLGGGQTVTGGVERLGGDSATVRIGSVEFRLAVDGVGRILGGQVPSQRLVIRREAAR